MKILEENVVNSFRLAKKDIIKMQNEIIKLRASHQALAVKVAKLESVGKVKKTVVKSNSKKQFWASKEGKKFHDIHCPFAKNIKPKSRVVFKSKNTALNNGYKPCSCVK